MVSQPASFNSRRAFTLIELLVVIGIIGVLIAIGLFVGRAVMGSGKQRATEALVQVADKALEAYYDKKGEGPPDRATYKSNAGEVYEFVLLDAREDKSGFDRDKDPAFNSFARFALACKDVPEADAVIKGISDPRQVRNVVLAAGIADNPSGGKADLRSVEFLDGFGQPLRFVHPAFHGGYGEYLDQSKSPSTLKARDPRKNVTERRGTSTRTFDVRRSYRPFDPNNLGSQDPRSAIGDADEGICPASRGYFYSSGVDRDPGTREDNVYSVKPSFAFETQAFN
jgi:prepilin-type N-terminal cleavage/methylation domain-containing protein